MCGIEEHCKTLWEESGIHRIADNGSPVAVKFLDPAVNVVVRTLSEARPDAIYCDRDQEEILMVFFVVPEHDEDVYERLIAAEEAMREALSSCEVEVRVRAHQGRAYHKAVPLGSTPVYVR